MNKNTLIGSILLAIVVIWWMTMNSANAEAQAAAQAKAREAAAIEAEKSKNADQLAMPVEAPATQGVLELAPAPKADAAPALVAGDAAAEGAAATAEGASGAAGDAAGDAATAGDAAGTAAAKPAKIEERIVTVETEKFIMTLENKGAKVRSIIVKALPDSAGNFPELIQDSTRGALELTVGQASLAEAMFSVDAPEWITVESDTTVEFTFADMNGNKVVRSYSFTKSGPSVRQVNRFVGFKPNDYKLGWMGGMKETEVLPKGKTLGANYFFSEVTFKNAEGIQRETFNDSKKFDESSISWAGLRRKYVAMAIQYDKAVPAVLNAEHVKLSEEEGDMGTYRLTLSDNLRGSDSLSYNFVVLPLRWDDLEALGQGYEKIIVTGSSWFPGSGVWFVWICKWLLKLLNFLYDLIPNYGVAIILLTIIVRGLTTPLTVKQLKSTRGLAKLKPQMDEINVKYRTDPEKKRIAMMELYQKAGVNPMASCTGCLPMFLQMPVFFGLFFVLGRAIELRGMPAFLWVTDLSHSDIVIHSFGIPFIMPDGISILPWIMVLTAYIQGKVTMSSSPGLDPAQQKMMIWMMPIMMFVCCSFVPSGLVIYWIVSNVWTILQYKLINRRIMGDVPNSKIKGKNVKDAQIVK